MLGLLGSSSDDSTSGSLVVHYDDGSTAAHTVTFPSWLKGPGGDAQAGVASPYHNGSNGPLSTQAYVYAVTVPLDRTKKAVAIGLPAASTAKVAMHIFAITAA